MAGKKRLDPESTSALEVVKAEQDREKLAVLEQQKKDAMRAQVYRMMGRIETGEFFRKLLTVGTLKWLKEVKESRLYAEVPEVGTWENYCKNIGLNHKHVWEALQNLEALGEEYLQTCQNLGLGYRDLRKLRKGIANGAIELTDAIIIEDTTKSAQEGKDGGEKAA